jgi:Domain of unknown function (DUF4166)/Saccharopine dehydrogenase NADP binding domain
VTEGRRIVVIGGTGSFGARLVAALVATTDLVVVIAARRIGPADDLAAALRARHPDRAIETCALDAAALTPDDLKRLGAWCVADCAGPFQGAEPRVAEAAIAAGAHYVDIADARDFVAGFPRLDEAARTAGVLAVTGASSTPGVSQSVLDDLTRGWRRIDTIEIAISPGNRQPRGLSVVTAILANTGQRARVFLDGVWTDRRSWGLIERRRMPGLGRRWLALVETPDLDLVPQRFGPQRAAIFRAGLEVGVLHLGLWGLSKLVALGALSSLAPFARPLRRISELLSPFGSGRGGMTVTADGLNAEGESVTATWALVAGPDGPNVPMLPALAIVRALAEGRLRHVGAEPCAGLLSLGEIARELARFRIITRRIVRPRPVFARALGPAFATLPQAIRAGHAVDGTLRFAGRASVTGAPSWLGRLFARLIGFPAPATDVPVAVEMQADRDDETWTRTFGEASFRSRLAAVAGRRAVVSERFGLLTFDLALTADRSGLDLTIVSGRLGRLHLPRVLLPRSHATERVDVEGRFCFDVPIALPGIGLLTHYRGWLVPEKRRAD